MAHHTPHEREEQDTTVSPSCTFFEQTLLLVDGMLEGDARKRATRHSSDCEVCGPLTGGWASVSNALRASFDDAAEAAKPDFGPMTNRIIERAFPANSAAGGTNSVGAFTRLLEYARSAQAWVVMGATALALVLVAPSLMKTPSPTSVDATESTAATVVSATTTSTASDDASPPPVMVVRDLSFGADSSGMVYRTPRGGMTVIWVTENEGA